MMSPTAGAADSLNLPRAWILLQLALLETTDPRHIQELFYRY